MGTYRFEPFGEPDVAREYLRALIESANEEIMLSIPRSILDPVRPALEAAIDRGVLVLLLLGGVRAEEDAETAFADVATLVHGWEQSDSLSVICTVDTRDGLCASRIVFEESVDPDNGVAFSHPLIGTHLFSTIIGNTWNRAPEVYVGEPDPLPATYESFSTAVINATLHKREGRAIDAEIVGKRVGTVDESVVVDGPVVNVRQSFVSPITNSFPVENSVFVRNADGEVVTVGGPGAFVEDVEAHEITLRQG